MTDFDRVRPATTQKCNTCQDEEKKCPCPVDEDEVEVIEDDRLVSDPDQEDDDDLVMYEDDDDDISGGLARKKKIKARHSAIDPVAWYGGCSRGRWRG